MNKPSAKTIFFAASMYYSERLVQELKERLSKNLMKYSFNNWFAVIDDDKFCSTSRFSESFLFHFFQPDEQMPDWKRIMLGYYLFKNCNRSRSARWNYSCQCLQQNSLFFHLFYFLTLARERRTNHLGPKNKASYCETKW